MSQAEASAAPLSEEEFRALFRENLRKRHQAAQEARAQQQPNQQPPPPPPQPAPRREPEVNDPAVAALDAEIGNAQAVAPIDRIWNFVWPLLKVALIATLFANGSLDRGLWIFGVIVFLKLLGSARNFFKIEFVRDRPPQHVAQQPRPPATRLRRIVYGTIKCTTAFFVSMFPTWRVEKLEAELRADGVLEFKD